MLSIDVGIKNLSLIVFGEPDADKDSIIGIKKGPDGKILWSIIDITPDLYKDTCTFVTRQKKVCGKPSVLKDTVTNSIFCGLHKKHVRPTSTYAELVSLDRNKISLDEIYTTLVHKLDDFFREHQTITATIDTVIIEKQPPKNPRMKALMSVLQSYFVIRAKVDHLYGMNIKDIYLIDPKHKLAVYKGPFVSASHLKQKYDQRKFLAVQYVRYMLRDFPKELEHFELAGPKRDDLADCYLQACYYWNRIHTKRASVYQTNMRMFYNSIDLSKVRKGLIMSDKRLATASTINLYTLKHLVVTKRISPTNIATHPLKQVVEKCSQRHLGGINNIWEDNN